MKELIGFNMIALAITLFLSWLLCVDWEWKDTVKLIIKDVLFVAFLSTGIYLMAY